MLHAEFIEPLFDRLTVRYGGAFLARWSGVDLDIVKDDWARQLLPYAGRPEAIAHALVLLDPAEPPTAAQFRNLCASAPAPAFRAVPETKQPQRAAEVRRAYLRPVAPMAGRERAWAADMVRRVQRGERVPGYNLRLALAALGEQPAGG